MSRAPKNINYKALGTKGIKRYGPYIYEEFIPELRWPNAGKIYKEMADNDSVIGSILYMTEMLIRGIEWKVESAGSTPEDIEAAEFLTSCMHDMDTSWAETITEILSMMTYGFSVHEIIYKVRRGPNERNIKYKSEFSDGRIGWRDLPIRSQGSIDQWHYDENNELKCVTQVAEPKFNRIDIPMSKVLLFRTRVSRGNPEGKSLLRNAYRSWFFKKHFEEIEGIGIERDLAGFPVLTAPESVDIFNEDDERMVALCTKAEELVTSVRRDSEEGMLLPYGWKLELLASSSSRQINIGDTINRYDKRIAITLLSDLILLGDKSGSFALSETKESMLAAALQAQVTNIADVINKKAVTQLFSYNTFSNLTGIPKIVPGKIQSPTLKELALMLRAMGLDVSKDLELQNHLRHILGMPILSEKDFKDIYVNVQEDSNKSDSVDDNNAGNNTHNNANTEDQNEDRDPSDRSFEQNDMNYTGGEM